MLQNVADIALARVAGGIEEVVVKVGPEQSVLVPMDLKRPVKPAHVDLHPAVIQGICEIHQVGQMNVLPGDPRLLPQLPIGCVLGVFSRLQMAAN